MTLSEKEINETLNDLKEAWEHNQEELNFSGNPTDWVTANAINNVLHGIENARQILVSKLNE